MVFNIKSAVKHL